MHMVTQRSPGRIAQRLLWLALACPVIGHANQAQLPALIDATTGGSWISPLANSQGLVLETFPGLNALAAYWFTFNDTGNGREWYIAVGDIVGNAADMQVSKVEGGLFGQSSASTEAVIGTARFELDDCLGGRFEFDAAELGMDTMILKRLAPNPACTRQLGASQVQFVTAGNAWFDMRGEWRFEGCVNLDDGRSHGREVFVFSDAALHITIDNYGQPGCAGPVQQALLAFELQRVDKVLAQLGATQVIANRVRLFEQASGAEVKQLFYLAVEHGMMRMTHGVLDSPPDADGYPSQLHSLFLEVPLP